jgi:hypothetical protein
MFNEYGVISVNLTMEILKGCGFSCSDCAVQKDFTTSDIPPEDSQDLLGLLDDLRVNEVRLFEFTVGPTDFISAQNGFETFKHPLVLGLAERFESMTLSLAMLSDNRLVELGGVIDRMIPEKKFRLVIPATLKNLQKPKYVEALRRRVHLLRDSLHSAKFYQIYLNSNMVQENLNELSYETVSNSGAADLGVRTTLEHGFGHARAGFQNLFNRDRFIYDLKLYVERSKVLKDTRYQRKLIPITTDALELTYRAGKLYYTPVVIEKFHIFDPVFEIPKPWTAQAVLDFKEQLYYRMLEKYVVHPLCRDCCFVNTCALGDHHVVMDYLKHDECLTDMKNRHDMDRKDTHGE